MWVTSKYSSPNVSDNVLVFLSQSGNSLGTADFTQNRNLGYLLCIM